ncbi:MAG: hypothetical protein HYY52_08715 [Candidatus Melainabacteria bacterium]|nr:hypothetical protein [Candidatus Melainabacteria bacterium]
MSLVSKVLPFVRQCFINRPDNNSIDRYWPEEPVDRRAFLKSTPGAVLAAGSIFSCKLQAAEPSKPQERLKSNPLIDPRFIKLARENPDTYFAMEFLQSQAYIPTVEDIKIALSGQETWYAYGVGKNPNVSDEDFKMLLKEAHEKTSTKLAFGVFQNKKNKVTPELQKELRETVTSSTPNKYNNTRATIIAMHPTWIMEDSDIKIALSGKAHWFIFWLTQNPTLGKQLSREDLKKFQDFIICHPNDGYLSAGFPQNSACEFDEGLIKTIRNNPTGWASHAALRNKKYPITNWEKMYSLCNPNSSLASGLTQTPYYFGEKSYTITDSEKDIAMKLFRSKYAYRITRDENCKILAQHKEFIRQSLDHANSAFAIGVAQNLQSLVDEDDLKWIIKNQANANTNYAYEVGLRLSYDQVNTKKFETKLGTKTESMTIKEAVTSYLVDTAFAEAVVQNINFSEEATNVKDNTVSYEVPKTYKRLARDAYNHTRFAAGLIQNPDYGEMEEEDIKAATSLDSRFAYYVAKLLKKEQITEAIEKYALSKPNSNFTLGLFENENYTASEKFRELIKVKSKDYIAYQLAMRRAYEVTYKDKQFAFENPNSHLAYGLGQNKSWGKVTKQEKIWCMKNPKTLLAKALASNIDCYEFEDNAKLEKEFFEGDSNNLKTPFANEIAIREDYPIGVDDIKRLEENLPTLYGLGLRLNPQNPTSLYKSLLR